jgi:hypothetical protein
MTLCVAVKAKGEMVCSASKQSYYAGKMWLKIAQSPVCVAFFQYTETTIEKISLC